MVEKDFNGIQCWFMWKPQDHSISFNKKLKTKMPKSSVNAISLRSPPILAVGIDQAKLHKHLHRLATSGKTQKSGALKLAFQVLHEPRGFNPTKDSLPAWQNKECDPDPPRMIPWSSQRMCHSTKAVSFLDYRQTRGLMTLCNHISSVRSCQSLSRR